MRPVHGVIIVTTLLFFISCGTKKPKESSGTALSSGAPPSSERSVRQQNRGAASKVQKIRVRQGDKEKVLSIKTKPIEDGCKMAVAQKVLKAQREKVTACAKRAGIRNGRAPNGKIIIGLALGPDGQPEQIVATQDDVQDPAFTDCIKRALNVVFPNPYQKRCLIQAPFQFSGVSAKP